MLRVSQAIGLQNMSRLESTAFWCLLFLVGIQAKDHQCTENVLSNCTNNPRLTVMKSRQSYKVTLHVNAWQCYHDFCIVGNHEHHRTLECKSICRVCGLLKPPGEIGKYKPSVLINLTCININFVQAVK